jgi:hypothetical protein
MTVRFFTVLVAALLLWGIPAAAQDEGTALLAKHRQFVGWRFDDGTFRDMRLTIARTTIEKREGTEVTVAGTTTQSRSGARYHSVSTRPESPAQSESGFDGQIFWAANVNGYLSASAPMSRPSRINFALNDLYDEAVSLLPAVLRPPAKIRDEDVAVIRVSSDLALPVDLYIDAAGAYRRAVIDPDAKVPLTIEIDAYLEALPGKKIIGKYRIGASSYEVTKAEPNVGITLADLRPPSPYPTWTFAGDVVPFTTAISGRGGRAVIVNATLDGHEGRFILDSGASNILLFSPFATTLDSEKVGSSAYTGINGRRTASDLVRIKELKVGGSVLHNVVVQTTPLGGLGGTDGLLGYDLLATAIVEVDLKTQKLTINDPKTYIPVPGEHAASFPVDSRPFTQVQLPEGAQATAILDTGNNYGVMLSDTLRSSGRLVALQTSAQRFSGADGSGDSALLCVRISRMIVGPYPYENASTCFGSSAAFGAAGGLIGFDFLRHFNWTFDYPHRRFILTPNGMN